MNTKKLINVSVDMPTTVLQNNTTNNMSKIVHKKVIYDLDEISTIQMKVDMEIDDIISNIPSYKLNSIIPTDKMDQTDKYILLMPKNHLILDTYGGRIVDRGCTTGQIANPAWKVYNIETKEIYILMYVEPNSLTALSLEAYEIICGDPDIKTWYKTDNGYVACSYKNSLIGEKIYIYMHVYIMNILRPTNDKSLTVDHIHSIDPQIDKIDNKCDNRLSNLRWATQAEQNENRPKIARHKNAFPLPDGYPESKETHIQFGHELYNKNTGAQRYFYVVDYPHLPRWSSCKSANVSGEQKYKEAQQRLREIEAGKLIPDIKRDVTYPIGIRITLFRNKNHFVLDHRNKTDGINYNLKMIIDENKTNDANYEEFKKEILNKYPNFEFKMRV